MPKSTHACRSWKRKEIKRKKRVYKGWIMALLDQQCANRVATGAAVGGALGASIGA